MFAPIDDVSVLPGDGNSPGKLVVGSGKWVSGSNDAKWFREKVERENQFDYFTISLDLIR